MTSFVSGYCAVRSLVPANDDDNDGDRGTEGNRQKGVRSKLHFTRCGISQIHERRTVSGALVKPRGISIGITLSLSLSLSLSFPLTPPCAFIPPLHCLRPFFFRSADGEPPVHPDETIDSFAGGQEGRARARARGGGGRGLGEY